ncbi:hypothetical protein BRADI_3g08320v3 [Brachypodium distachyon]|uniref:BRCT domain-containing protein n=2 Tax=Brachypodium distachyon TaxID=15368 RepID=A0A2K2CVY0_BRADI|nr:hypothetical protein BRADI_3g08320v3 [Brachypodium distachyon]
MFLGMGSDCSHLIVCTCTVDKHHEWCEKGAKGNCMIVNDLWLDHCIRGGALVPTEKVWVFFYIASRQIEPESKPSCRLDEYLKSEHISILGPIDSSNNRRSNAEGNVEMNETRAPISMRFSTPTGGPTHSSTYRLSKSTGDKNRMVKTEPESKPSCKRSLEFNSHETPVDEYLKTEDRIESVQYPFCSIPRDLASPISKRVLMKAYLEVARSHNANESFEGIFSWKNFLVSEQSEILKLVGVRAVPLTPDGRKADGKKFAMLVRGLFDDGLPEDLKGWLKNMEQGWEDALLLNHIYMRDRRSTLGEFLMMYHCLLGLEGYDSTKYEAFVKSLATYNAWHHNGFK